MGLFGDVVPLVSYGRRKAFFKRIHAAQQQEQAGGQNWLAELHQHIRKTSSAALSGYHYAGKIGEGEYGEVHLLRDTSGKEYALKIMEATEHEYQYIISEALLWKRVDSCTVARLYDAFCIGPLCFFVLELGGITLDVWLQKKLRKASADVILSHMLVLLCSLDALHNFAGIIHGDLKPDNVVRSATSLLKLIDFGCAAEIDPRGQQQVGPEGSMAFMSPEKMFHGRDGTAADIYAMGGILYQLVFGYDTFPYCPQERFMQCYSSHEEAVADWHNALATCDFIVPSHSHLPSAHMPAVLELLRGMLAKEPAQRWSLEQCVCSAAFSDDLLRALRQQVPALAAHIDHFLDIRASSASALNCVSAAYPSSSCGDSLASRMPSFSSVASSASGCSRAVTPHHHHQQQTPTSQQQQQQQQQPALYRVPSISAINIRPATFARTHSSSSLGDCEPHSCCDTDAPRRQHHKGLYTLPASPADSPKHSTASSTDDVQCGDAAPCTEAAAQPQPARPKRKGRFRYMCKLLWRVLRCTYALPAADLPALSSPPSSKLARSVTAPPAVLLCKPAQPGPVAVPVAVADTSVDFKIAACVDS